MDAVINKLKLHHDKPIVVANHHGTIIFVNAEFEALFQWSTEEIINQPLSVIIPSHLHDAHHIGFSRFIATEQPTLLGLSLDLPAVKKNGEQFNAAHIIQAIKKNGSWLIGANICQTDNR